MLAKLPHSRKISERVTASIGVAFFPRHGAVLDEVVNVADVAMYQAKAQGRDSIVLAPDPAPKPVSPWRSEKGA